MTGQLTMDLERKAWGGKRAGAGRNRDRTRRDPSHATRPKHARAKPLHVVLRTVEGVPRLRSNAILVAIRAALGRVKNNDDLRVVHISIQHNHIHAIVEAVDSRARTLGMQSLAIALARAINRASARHGRVFQYRYHATSIATPRQMRNTLAYVLGNWRHHSEHLASRAARAATFDPYSSANHFDGWKAAPPTTPFDSALPVDPPTLWLLTVGWRRHGPIDPWIRPGSGRDHDSGINLTRFSSSPTTK